MTKSNARETCLSVSLKSLSLMEYTPTVHLPKCSSYHHTRTREKNAAEKHVAEEGCRRKGCSEDTAGHKEHGRTPDIWQEDGEDYHLIEKKKDGVRRRRNTME